MLQVRFLFERPSGWELVRRVEPAAGPGVGSVSCNAASQTSAPQQQQQSAAGKSLQLTFSRRSQVRLLMPVPLSLQPDMQTESHTASNVRTKFSQRPLSQNHAVTAP